MESPVLTIYGNEESAELTELLKYVKSIATIFRGKTGMAIKVNLVRGSDGPWASVPTSAGDITDMEIKDYLVKLVHAATVQVKKQSAPPVKESFEPISDDRQEEPIKMEKFTGSAGRIAKTSTESTNVPMPTDAPPTMAKNVTSKMQSAPKAGLKMGKADGKLIGRIRDSEARANRMFSGVGDYMDPSMQQDMMLYDVMKKQKGGT